jgi:hypothetical protein
VEGRQGHGFRDEAAAVSYQAALETFLAKHLLNRGSVNIGDPRVIEMPAKKKK